MRHAPEQTEAAIAAQARGAIVDTATGEFNRHSDGRRGYAFLESGGILVMSLLWLANQTGKDAYRDLAKRVAGYSFSFCDPSTGLMMNAPGSTRWNGISVTSEVGMWARCLQCAARISGNSEFAEMAYFVLERWLEFSWSDSEQQFFGRLRVKDGQPILEEPDTVYQPPRFCDPWHPLFPRHDYPFPCAQACLEAYRATGRKIFRIGTERWITAMHNSLNADKTRVIYAEHYGRFIHLLQDAAQTLDRPAYRQMAVEVAARCLTDLCPEGRFRTHAREWRYDSVDGFGFLALALLKLCTPSDPRPGERVGARGEKANSWQ